MSMVDIGHMRVLVRQGLMLMWMRVRLRGHRLVLMAMVLVVHMSVIVLDRLMRVQVLVLGAQEEDDACRHDRHREKLPCADALAEESRRNQRTDEGTGREVRSLPSCAQQAERAHRADDAQAVAEEPKEHPVSHLA